MQVERLFCVTPFAGVWIEIVTSISSPVSSSVTPFAGVWIEMDATFRSDNAILVTPFAGVWIEIRKRVGRIERNTSLPSRECGLKSV